MSDHTPLLPHQEAMQTVSLPDMIVEKQAPFPPNPLLSLEYTRIGTGALVTAEPSEIRFPLTESRGTMMQILRLINTSGRPLRMHILPPSTPFFSISFEKRGRLMPGMAEEVTTRFTGTDLRYYHDVIRIHLEEENMTVPLHAYPALELELPGQIEMGNVPLGECVVRTLPLSSRLDVLFDFEISLLVEHRDITISPTRGVVRPNEEVGLEISYRPTRLVTARAVFSLALSQLDFAPRKIEVVGSSMPSLNKQARLRELRSDMAARWEGEEGDGEGWEWQEGGGEGGEEEFARPEGEPLSETAALRALWDEPSPELIAAAAVSGGGGSGGGDCVTRARRLELSRYVPNAKPPALPPVLVLPRTTVVDGYRVAAHLALEKPPVYATSSILMQQPNKVPFSELRDELLAQEQAAERTARAAAAAARAQLPPVEGLIDFLAGAEGERVVRHLEYEDLDCTGLVTCEQLVKALPVFGGLAKVARPADMRVVFERIAKGAESINYRNLTRLARRVNASLAAGRVGAVVDVSDLDLALLSDKSRQLKELQFTREMGGVEKAEKEKQVKSTVAIGQPLVSAELVKATQDARAAFYESVAFREREESRARGSAELSTARVRIDEEQAAAVANLRPKFSSYLNDAWESRQAVLSTFQQAVRVAVLRARIERRLRAVRHALHRAGVSMQDADAMKQFVASSSNGSAHKPPPQEGSVLLSEEEVDIPSCIDRALQLSAIAPFVFPEGPAADSVQRSDPIEVTPLPTIDEGRLFALRVPRRHTLMNYKPLPFTSPGSFPKLEDSRPTRSGASYESGSALPTGVPAKSPSVHLPQQLLKNVPPPPKGEEVVDTRPRLLQTPLPYSEVDARLQLWARPVKPNSFWRSELIGSDSCVALLDEPTISDRFRPLCEAWPDARVKLPAELEGVVPAHVAEELSDDESDTALEIEQATRKRLVELFELPSPGPTTADALLLEQAGPDEPGMVVVDSDRVLPIDEGSEMNRMMASVEQQLTKQRREQRAVLRSKLVELYETHGSRDS